eukprot:scaffold31406_cov73-Skeletonema_marinoi.AAC.1
MVDIQFRYTLPPPHHACRPPIRVNRFTSRGGRAPTKTVHFTSPDKFELTVKFDIKAESCRCHFLQIKFIVHTWRTTIVGRVVHSEDSSMIHAVAVVVLNTKFLVKVPILRSGLKVLAKECSVGVGCLYSSRGEGECNSDDCVFNMHHAATLLLLLIALLMCKRLCCVLKGEGHRRREIDEKTETLMSV